MSLELDTLSLTQAARLAGVSSDTVRYWVRRGRLHTQRDGGGRLSIRLADLEAARVVVLVSGVLRIWRRGRRTAGLRLRSRREAAGLSQLDLAAASGVSHETISKLERGRRAPRAETILRLARGLNVRPSELVAGALSVGESVTAREAALHLRVSDRTVRRWIDAGVLPAAKVAGRWRIPASALAAAPERRAVRRGRERLHTRK